MSVRRENNGTYTVQYRVKNLDGTVTNKKKRNFKSKKEAAEYEACQKRIETKSDLKFGEFYSVYVSDKRHEIKERTLMTKDEIYRMHIKPYFENKKISDISSRDLMQWQNEVQKKKYSDAYLHMISKEMSAILTHAVIFYGLEENPYRQVKKMGSTKNKDVEFWTLEEFNIFMSGIEENTMYHVLFNILMFTGIRIGECLALTPEDVDFDNNVLSINKTYFRRNRIDYITEPKTENSKRKVILPESIKEELKCYISRIYGIGGNDRIFPVVAEAVQHKMRRVIEATGVKRIRLHALRHSFATLCISSGCDIHLLQSVLGHSKASITMDVYSHLMPNRKTELAEKLNEIMKG